MISLEQWARTVAVEVGKVMKAHGIKSFHMDLTEKGAVQYELTPINDQQTEQLNQNGELKA